MNIIFWLGEGAVIPLAPLTPVPLYNIHVNKLLPWIEGKVQPPHTHSEPRKSRYRVS